MWSHRVDDALDRIAQSLAPLVHSNNDKWPHLHGAIMNMLISAGALWTLHRKYSAFCFAIFNWLFFLRSQVHVMRFFVCIDCLIVCPVLWIGFFCNFAAFHMRSTHFSHILRHSVLLAVYVLELISVNAIAARCARFFLSLLLRLLHIFSESKYWCDFFMLQMTCWRHCTHCYHSHRIHFSAFVYLFWFSALSLLSLCFASVCNPNINIIQFFCGLFLCRLRLSKRTERERMTHTRDRALWKTTQAVGPFWVRKQKPQNYEVHKIQKASSLYTTRHLHI